MELSKRALCIHETKSGAKSPHCVGLVLRAALHRRVICSLLMISLQGQIWLWAGRRSGGLESWVTVAGIRINTSRWGSSYLGSKVNRIGTTCGCSGGFGDVALSRAGGELRPHGTNCGEGLESVHQLASICQIKRSLETPDRSSYREVR
jgi:hypothetical protein